MAAADAKRGLVWHGLVLFFLGLLTGFIIPSLTNPRMGLSAHMEALLNGMFLILAGGVVWDHFKLSEKAERTVYWLLLYAAYGSWVFCLLAAVVGASQTLPIAGAGYAAAPWQELLIKVGLGLVAISITVACCVTLYGIRKKPRESAG